LQRNNAKSLGESPVDDTSLGRYLGTSRCSAAGVLGGYILESAKIIGSNITTGMAEMGKKIGEALSQSVADAIKSLGDPN